MPAIRRVQIGAGWDQAAPFSEFVQLCKPDPVSLCRLSPVSLRKNYNFHRNEADVSNRLLNAIEPGSYVVLHRHLDATKDETFVVLRGRFGLVLFDESGIFNR